MVKDFGESISPVQDLKKTQLYEHCGSETDIDSLGLSRLSDQGDGRTRNVRGSRPKPNPFCACATVGLYILHCDVRY